MSETRVYNFSAGPAALPLPALEEAQRDLLCLPGAGASVMEISHRGKEFSAVHEQAKSNVKQLLGLSDDYQVLFVQGGASLQFSMAPMNFMAGGATADYIVTGSWASKAIKEAQKFGQPNVAWDGKADGYSRLPDQSELKLNKDAAYVHFTSNETIEGIEFSEEPETGGVPLVCDASSDILSRPLPLERYGLIYAGAQKNLGPSGVALVIVRKDMLERVPKGLPSLLDYRLIADQDSLYNTPPCFSIYVIMLVTKWLLKEIGGLEEMAAINRRKAQLLYDAIDHSGGFYRGHAKPECRSLMNVTWRMPSEDLEKEFIAEAQKNGMAGLKGHRSVGGLRASIYNAMPEQGVAALRDFMIEFQKSRG